MTLFTSPTPQAAPLAVSECTAKQRRRMRLSGCLRLSWEVSRTQEVEEPREAAGNRMRSSTCRSSSQSRTHVLKVLATQGGKERRETREERLS